MMSQSFERRTVSLVVRLWVEPMEQSGVSQWRGQIEQVGSGEKAHFHDVAGLLEKLANWAPGFVSPGATRKEG